MSEQSASKPREPGTPPDQLIRWLDKFSGYTPVDWQHLPELELYMDQVITFMNRMFEPLTTDDERLLTSSMINNYVKDHVLPRPEKKKYSREHLAMLTMICALKSVMQLPEIDGILRGLTAGCGIEEQYPVFLHIHGEAVSEIAERVKSADTCDATTRYLLAFQFALEANVRRIAAARLLASLDTPTREADKDKN